MYPDGVNTAFTAPREFLSFKRPSVRFRGTDSRFKCSANYKKRHLNKIPVDTDTDTQYLFNVVYM